MEGKLHYYVRPSVRRGKVYTLCGKRVLRGNAVMQMDRVTCKTCRAIWRNNRQKMSARYI